MSGGYASCCQELEKDSRVKATGTLLKQARWSVMDSTNHFLGLVYNMIIKSVLNRDRG